MAARPIGRRRHRPLLLAVLGGGIFAATSGVAGAPLAEEDQEPDDFDLEDELSVSAAAAHGVHDWRGPLAEQVAADFERHAAEEHLEDVMTPDELERYKARFMAAARGKAVSMDISDGADAAAHASQWQATLQSSLANEMPAVTQHLAAKVNHASLGWSAEAGSWAQDLSVGDAQSLMGFVHDPDIENTRPEHFSEEIRRLASFLRSFDSRQQWPHCAETINHVRNQGKCGSCWAQSAAAAMDGRLCISSGGKFSGDKAWISAGYITACYNMPVINGCAGGNPGWALSRLKANFVPGMGGAPTGGEHGGTCVPYFGSGDALSHFDGKNMKAPSCPTQCQGAYPRSLNQDKFYTTSTPTSSKSLNDAKRALMEGGPIPMAFTVFQDFMAYKSGYYDRSVSKAMGGHATTLVGWENVEYLVSSNSWGERWGERGFFKMKASCCGVTYFISQVAGGRPQALPLPGAGATSTAASYRSSAGGHGFAMPRSGKTPLSKMGARVRSGIRSMFRKHHDVNGTEAEAQSEDAGSGTTDIVAAAAWAGVDVRTVRVVYDISGLACEALDAEARARLERAASTAIVGKLGMLLPDAVVQSEEKVPSRVSVQSCTQLRLAPKRFWKCDGEMAGTNATGIAFLVSLPASRVTELLSIRAKALESREALEIRLSEAVGWRPSVQRQCFSLDMPAFGSALSPGDAELDAVVDENFFGAEGASEVYEASAASFGGGAGEARRGVRIVYDLAGVDCASLDDAKRAELEDAGSRLVVGRLRALLGRDAQIEDEAGQADRLSVQPCTAQRMEPHRFWKCDGGKPQSASTGLAFKISMPASRVRELLGVREKALESKASFQALLQQSLGPEAEIAQQCFSLDMPSFGGVPRAEGKASNSFALGSGAEPSSASRRVRIVYELDNVDCSALTNDERVKLEELASRVIVGKLGTLLPDAEVQDESNAPQRVSVQACDAQRLSSHRFWKCDGHASQGHATGVAFSISMPANRIKELLNVKAKALESKAALEDRLEEAVGHKASIVQQCFSLDMSAFGVPPRAGSAHALSTASASSLNMRSVRVVYELDKLDCDSLNPEAKSKLETVASHSIVSKLGKLLPDAVIEDDDHIPQHVSVQSCKGERLAANRFWKCDGPGAGAKATGIAFSISMPANKVRELLSVKTKALESKAALEEQIEESLGSRPDVAKQCFSIDMPALGGVPRASIAGPDQNFASSDMLALGAAERRVRIVYEVDNVDCDTLTTDEKLKLEELASQTIVAKLGALLPDATINDENDVRQRVSLQACSAQRLSANRFWKCDGHAAVGKTVGIAFVIAMPANQVKQLLSVKAKALESKAALEARLEEAMGHKADIAKQCFSLDMPAFRDAGSAASPWICLPLEVYHRRQEQLTQTALRHLVRLQAQQNAGSV
eukprot:TRINITY_DN1948_c0_g1_i2.p1 TRINITY_DN1948_c0_g1~~TRINITY_DN1948_c0_g1_i2.p1  ORF type:complete len:1430 (-),score=330.27 TRINITY_DN1948_c0_g1_i2:1468-5688(-)